MPVAVSAPLLALPPVAVGCVEGGASAVVYGYVDEDIELNAENIVIATALGCATGGAVHKLGGLVANRVSPRIPRISNELFNQRAVAQSITHPELVVARQQSNLRDFLRTNFRKSNFGEMSTGEVLRLNGWEAVHKNVIDSIDAPRQGSGHGIDHIFKRTNPDGTVDYIIVDSKFGESSRGTVNPTPPETERVKQMSKIWIESRVVDAVGGDDKLAEKILMSYVPVLSKIDAVTGAVSFEELDSLARPIGPWTP